SGRARSSCRSSSSRSTRTRKRPSAASTKPSPEADAPMAVWTIVVAAGTGNRFGGDVPKQYREVAGRRVLDWSLADASAVSDGVVLVVAPDRVDDAEP